MAEVAVEQMRGQGYKATPQRLTILRELAGEPYLSVAELRRRCPGVGMVTVYRTLWLLLELGIVRRVDLGAGPRYELAGGRSSRLICEPCGRVFDLGEGATELERLLEQAGLKAQVERVEVYAWCRGRCNDCS